MVKCKVVGSSKDSVFYAFIYEHGEGQERSVSKSTFRDTYERISNSPTI